MVEVGQSGGDMAELTGEAGNDDGGRIRRCGAGLLLVLLGAWGALIPF